ncbi:unnamed protein product [Ilex paraguariensis]|uniref:F-box domain-containing protein n=1 Tax=Ilex paraguariensis TaxID=185542 RepID=A0ABC8UAJ8_9AQUA
MGRRKSKRQKLFEGVKLLETKDRISNLPNSLIGHILSFLPTKYAVQTCVLTTKWKQMWTFISNIDFDSREIWSIDDPCHISFVKFVYRVLLFLKVSKVNKFHFRYYVDCDVSDVNAWLSTVLSCNVRELDLCISLKVPCLLSADLFTCNSLVVVKLGTKFVLNDVPSLVSLQNLTTLRLSSVEFRDDESTKRLFSSCPVLEGLALYQCEGKRTSVLKISAPALKTLYISYPMSDSWAIYHHSEFSKYKIELNIPGLLLLKYWGPVSEVYAMKNLCSLVKVDIQFYIDSGWGDYEFYQRSTTELAQEIYNVHSLHLSGGSIDYDSFLANRPFRCGLLHDDIIIEDEINTDNWAPPERLPSCLKFHLKMIDIGEFEGEKYELKMGKADGPNLSNVPALNTVVGSVRDVMGSVSKLQSLFEEVKLNETEDKISNLPASLIGHILSFLPTKCAVRTSILSNKRKHMWTITSNLDLKYDDQKLSKPRRSKDDQRHMSFVKFVNRVLLLLKVSKLNKFRIRDHFACDVSDVIPWLSAALSRNVRELEFYGSLKGLFLLPADLFTCNSLVILKLGRRFVLNDIPSSVCLLNLKTLHLDSVGFRNDE